MKAASFLLVLVFFFLCSCTIKDDFTELTSHDDLIIETKVFLKDPVDKYDLSFIHYRTNGFDKLVKDFKSFSGPSYSESVTFSFAVKDYKKAGIGIVPGENIADIWINIYEVGLERDIYFQYHHDKVEPFTLMYDFESDSYEILEE